MNGFLLYFCFFWKDEQLPRIRWVSWCKNVTAADGYFWALRNLPTITKNCFLIVVFSFAQMIYVYHPKSEKCQKEMALFGQHFPKYVIVILEIN